MLTQGRSILYLKKILPKSNCCIITCGYMAEGTPGWKIKNNSSLKTVTIDKKKYKNRCNIKSLGSFSSHMQFEQLCEYYTNVAKDGCGTIWLVHGDDYKTELKLVSDDISIPRDNINNKNTQQNSFNMNIEELVESFVSDPLFNFTKEDALPGVS